MPDLERVSTSPTPEMKRSIGGRSCGEYYGGYMFGLLCYTLNGGLLDSNNLFRPPDFGDISQL